MYLIFTLLSGCFSICTDCITCLTHFLLFFFLFPWRSISLSLSHIFSVRSLRPNDLTAVPPWVFPLSTQGHSASLLSSFYSCSVASVVLKSRELFEVVFAHFPGPLLVTLGGSCGLLLLSTTSVFPFLFLLLRISITLTLPTFCSLDSIPFTQEGGGADVVAMPLLQVPHSCYGSGPPPASPSPTRTSSAKSWSRGPTTSSATSPTLWSGSSKATAWSASEGRNGLTTGRSLHPPSIWTISR